MEQKTSNLHLQILQNRMQKLDFEEKRAKAKIERAQERVRELEMQKALKQREKDQINKFKLQLERIVEKQK